MNNANVVTAISFKNALGILDEINMTRNEALAVLHSVLDFCHVIDIPDYNRIH